MDGWVLNVWMEGWIVTQMDELMYRYIDRNDGSMDVCMDGWMDGWFD
jgi:hypothetical protein